MNVVTISKFLAKHLRHSPEAIGLALEPGGWVTVSDLLHACNAKGFPITPEVLKQVVDTNDKKRFDFNEDGTKIRANQGHSTPVEMDFQEVTPPDKLYHGAVEKFMPAIMVSGLQKMARHHVHLSQDIETATKVGSRRGKPVVLEVDAAAMSAIGYKFFRSTNGVWLTDFVHPLYLTRLWEA